MTEEKKNQLITALITQPNKTKACKSVGISTKTLYNLMQDNDFMIDLKIAYNRLIDDTILELKSAMSNGAKALNDIICNEDTPPDIRLKAIRTAIEYGTKLAVCDNEIKADLMTEAIVTMVNDYQ